MEDASTLDLSELLAMQPKRTGGLLAPGQRLPGGERAGVVRAQGSEFDSISPYMPGDDVRRIDWRATARSGRTQMRRVAATAHRARCVVFNLSDELFFGTSGRVMAKTGALSAALKCWEALALNEPVGLELGVEPELAIPRRGQRHVERILEGLWRRYQEVGQGRGGSEPAPLHSLMATAAARLRRRDELCVIDEFPNLDGAFQTMSSALAEQRSLTAVVVEDPIVRQGLASGRYTFLSGQDARVESIDIGESAAQNSGADLLRLRREHRRRLSACGWSIVEAIDILPTQDHPQSAAK